MTRTIPLRFAAVLMMCTAAYVFTGQARAPEAAPTRVSPQSAVLQVDRPAGADDAIWQREIATLATAAQFNEIVADTLNDEVTQKLKDKIRTGLLASEETFAAAITVRLVPGTALIELRVNCSDDAFVNAHVTKAMARHLNEYLNQQRSQMENARKASLNIVLKRAEDDYRISSENLQAFRKSQGIDVPLADNANPVVQRDRAGVMRLLDEKMAELDQLRAVLGEVRRQVMLLELSPSQSVRTVQEPAARPASP